MPASGTDVCAPSGVALASGVVVVDESGVPVDAASGVVVMDESGTIVECPASDRLMIGVEESSGGEELLELLEEDVVDPSGAGAPFGTQQVPTEQGYGKEPAHCV